MDNDKIMKVALQPKTPESSIKKGLRRNAVGLGARVVELVDTAVFKTVALGGLWVRIPPRAPLLLHSFIKPFYHGQLSSHTRVRCLDHIRGAGTIPARSPRSCGFTLLL